MVNAGRVRRPALAILSRRTTIERGVGMYTVGIAGYGVVGRHMHSIFPNANVNDKYQGPKDDLNGSDFVFVCVPTPLSGRSLDCSEIEAVVSETNAGCFVIRSTPNVGFTDYLARKYKKNIVFQPELLGESPNHSMGNLRQPEVLTLGGPPELRRQVINLYATVYNSKVKIRQLTRLEAEVTKLTENRAILFKLMQIQELYDACEANGIDFYTIRDAVYGDDPRFDLEWSFVYPNNRGANSKCIPKDVFAWSEWASREGYLPRATDAMLNYNSELLRLNLDES